MKRFTKRIDMDCKLNNCEKHQSCNSNNKLMSSVLENDDENNVLAWQGIGR